MTEVLVREQDGILHLTLDRPLKKNALTTAMYRALCDGLDRAAASEAIRAVLISGSGQDFCAGNDVADFLLHGDAPAHALPSVRFMELLVRFAKPVVAAVQGLAVGIGTTMLLHCDLVYAAEDARFSTPFVRLGLVPEAGSSLLLPQRIGPARANAMLLLGDTLDARAAHLAGLVNAVLPTDSLLAFAMAQANTLAALPAEALRASKQLIRGDQATLETRIDQELVAFGTALRSADARNAFDAFLRRSRKDRPSARSSTPGQHNDADSTGPVVDGNTCSVPYRGNPYAVDGQPVAGPPPSGQENKASGAAAAEARTIRRHADGASTARG